MKTVKQALIFISLILLIAIAVLIWTANSNQVQYDTSQLEPSRYGDIDSHETIVEISGNKKLSANQTMFTLTLHNRSDDVLYFGEPFVIEVLVDGKWYGVPFKEDEVLFIMPRYFLYPNSDKDFIVNLERHDCHPGKHRIVKEITQENSIDETGEKEITVMIATFELNIH